MSYKLAPRARALLAHAASLARARQPAADGAGAAMARPAADSAATRLAGALRSWGAAYDDDVDDLARRRRGWARGDRRFKRPHARRDVDDLAALIALASRELTAWLRERGMPTLEPWSPGTSRRRRRRADAELDEIEEMLQ